MPDEIDNELDGTTDPEFGTEAAGETGYDFEGMDFGTEDEKEVDVVDLLPPGKYAATILTVEPRDSKKGVRMLDVLYEVGDRRKWVRDYYLMYDLKNLPDGTSEETAVRLNNLTKRWLKLLGVPINKESIVNVFYNKEVGQLEKQTVTVKIKHDAATEEYAAQERIAAVNKYVPTEAPLEQSLD